MTFLNPHRENSGDLAKSSANKSRHKKDKAADSGANLSRYFTSTKSANHNELLPDARTTAGLNKFSSEREPPRHDERRPKSKDRDPSLPLVELLEKPFLGFGSSGIYSTSPARVSRNVGSIVDPPRGKASSRGSTSHVSWSVSGAASHHSPHLHYSDKTSTRSPIHIERTRASITDVPLALAEMQSLDKGPKPVSVKNDTCEDCSRLILESCDSGPEKGMGNRSIQFAHQPISNSVKQHYTPYNPSSDNHCSHKESKRQQSLSNDKIKAASLEQGQAELSCLPVPGSSGSMSQEDSSTLFDAELDNFLQKFKINQRHDLAPQPSALCAQSKIPIIIDHEKSINLEKTTDGLSASENQHINRVENSSLRHDSTKSSEIPSTEALEVRVSHTGRPSGPESLSPARRSGPGNFQDSCISGDTKDRSEQMIESNSHDILTRNAWSGYNNIYQQQTEIGSHDSRNHQGCDKVHVPVDFEGPKNSFTSNDRLNNIHNELEGHDGYENMESKRLNGNMMGFGDHGDSHHDESLMSAPHNTEELFYQSTLTRGTELDFPPYRNGLLHHKDVLSGDTLELEDGSPYLINHDLDSSALPNNNDKYKHVPDEKRWLEGCQQLDVRPRLRSHNGTYNLGGNRWMASVQQNNDELPGFWKPHKRY